MSQSTDQLAPGLAQSVAQGRQELAASAAEATTQQFDARRFILEHGAQVLGGHAPVGGVPTDLGRQA